MPIYTDLFQNDFLLPIYYIILSDFFFVLVSILIFYMLIVFRKFFC